nr:prolyl oligopeptidase family protein [Tanacetum cinerariifolium]
MPTETELALEQTQQGVSYEVSKDLIPQAENSVKEILLKLNLLDQRSILTDSKIHIKMDIEGGGGDQGLLLPQLMRLDVPEFLGDDPHRWIFAIKVFSLLNTPADQPLWIVGFNLKGARELLVSKPTSLGDVFLLALTIEARLDDQAAPLTGTSAGLKANKVVNDGDGKLAISPNQKTFFAKKHRYLISYLEQLLRTMLIRCARGVEIRLTVKIVSIVPINRATIKTFVIIIIHKIHRVFHNNIFVVKTYPIDQSPPQEMSIQDMQINDLKENFNGISIKILKITKENELRQREQVANLSIYIVEPSRCFDSFCYDDDEESTISLNEIISQNPSSIAITPILPIEDPDDFLITGKKESDEVIKSSVEDLVRIPSKSKDTSESDSECDLHACDDFSPIDVLEGKSLTFSNPLFDLNNDFTSSDDESLSDKDVPEDNVKIYSNPLFEFDDEYISSDVNHHFDEVLEDVGSKDECFDSGGDVDEINAFDIPSDFKDCYYDSEGDIIYLESFLSDDTTHNPPPEVFLNHDLRSLSDINDLEIMVKVFDPGNPEKIIL